MLLIEWNVSSGSLTPHSYEPWMSHIKLRAKWVTLTQSHFSIYICAALRRGVRGWLLWNKSEKQEEQGKEVKWKKSFWVKYEAWKGIERVRTWENKGGGGVSGSERPTIHYLLNRKECDAFVSRLQSAIFHLKVWIWHRAAQISNLLAACTVSRSSSHLLNLLCCFSVICI